MSFIVDTGTYWLLSFNQFPYFMTQRAEWGRRILFRTEEGESGFELSGDEVEEGQTVEQEGDCSEEDISAFEEPEQGQRDIAHSPLMDKKHNV